MGAAMISLQVRRAVNPAIFTQQWHQHPGFHHRLGQDLQCRWVEGNCPIDIQLRLARQMEQSWAHYHGAGQFPSHSQCFPLWYTWNEVWSSFKSNNYFWLTNYIWIIGCSPNSTWFEYFGGRWLSMPFCIR